MVGRLLVDVKVFVAKATQELSLLCLVRTETRFGSSACWFRTEPLPFGAELETFFSNFLFHLTVFVFIAAPLKPLSFTHLVNMINVRGFRDLKNLNGCYSETKLSHALY